MAQRDEPALPGDLRLADLLAGAGKVVKGEPWELALQERPA